MEKKAKAKKYYQTNKKYVEDCESNKEIFLKNRNKNISDKNRNKNILLL